MFNPGDDSNGQSIRSHYYFYVDDDGFNKFCLVANRKVVTNTHKVNISYFYKIFSIPHLLI